MDEIVAVDETIARESDCILISTPLRIPLVDALIAAAARSRRAILVHRDTHMRAIPPDTVEQLDLASDGNP